MSLLTPWFYNASLNYLSSTKNTLNLIKENKPVQIVKLVNNSYSSFILTDSHFLFIGILSELALGRFLKQYNSASQVTNENFSIEKMFISGVALSVDEWRLQLVNGHLVLLIERFSFLTETHLPNSNHPYIMDNSVISEVLEEYMVNGNKDANQPEAQSQLNETLDPREWNQIEDFVCSQIQTPQTKQLRQGEELESDESQLIVPAKQWDMIMQQFKSTTDAIMPLSKPFSTPQYYQSHSSPIKEKDTNEIEDLWIKKSSPIKQHITNNEPIINSLDTDDWLKSRSPKKINPITPLKANSPKKINSITPLKTKSQTKVSDNDHTEKRDLSNAKTKASNTAKGDNLIMSFLMEKINKIKDSSPDMLDGVIRLINENILHKNDVEIELELEEEEKAKEEKENANHKESTPTILSKEQQTTSPIKIQLTPKKVLFKAENNNKDDEKNIVTSSPIVIGKRRQKLYTDW